MAINWTQVITNTVRENANLALASYFVEPGERKLLSRFYGVGIRTVDRWFASSNQQRRPCMVRATNGKRLINLAGSRRLDYLRLRALLPFLYAYGGIERTLDEEEVGEGNVRSVVYDFPSLAKALDVARAFLTRTGIIDDFLEATWIHIYIQETENQNPWQLVVVYFKPDGYEETVLLLSGDRAVQEEDTEEEEGEVFGVNYDEYDDESNEGAWMYEPE